MKIRIAISAAVAVLGGLCAASQADIITYSGDVLNEPDGSWDRPIEDGPSISSLGPVEYDAQPFWVGTTGQYDIFSEQDYDGYLTLYEIPVFDPEDQLNGLIAGNDDDGFQMSAMEDMTLQANVQYWLITSEFAMNSAEMAGVGTFTNTIDGPGPINLGIIPAPGALALLGLAGLVGSRRRRTT